MISFRITYLYFEHQAISEQPQKNLLSTIVDGIEFQTSALFSRFEITKEDLEAGEEVATCPSCSLIVRVIYDPEDFDQDEEKLAKDVKSLTIAQTN